jgi:AraC-like DNA-binding protein
MFGHHINTGEYSPPWHYHDIYEIFYAAVPGIRYLVGNRIYTLEAGGLMVFNGFDVHVSMPPEGVPYERYIILFQPEFITPWNNGEIDLLGCFRNRGNDFSHHRQLNREERKYFTSLYTKGHEHARNRQNGSTIRLRIVLTELLLFINELYSGHSTGSKERPQGQQKLEKILRYMDSRIREDISLSGLAREFGMSVNRFSGYFKSCTSFTPKQYVIQKRIQLARIMLSQGKSVTETAMDSGFGNLSHFIRIFKQKTGWTPGAYASRAIP